MVSAFCEKGLKESLATFLGSIAIHPKASAIRPLCMLRADDPLKTISNAPAQFNLSASTGFSNKSYPVRVTSVAEQIACKTAVISGFTQGHRAAITKSRNGEYR